MKARINSLLLMTALLGLLANEACSPAYVSNVANVPIFEEKGDLQLGLHAGFAGLDPQISYAFHDHIAVVANGSFYNNTNDTLNNFHVHNFGEPGIGYFTALGKHERVSLFGGYGGGNVCGFYANNL